MRKTGTALSPLHRGHCPPWLFAEMRGLSAAVVAAMVELYGTEQALARFADPVWFQSFGMLLGFDWHSSGLTTVVLGALKEGLADRQGELGLFLAGGKGSAGRKTPSEIHAAGERFALPASLDGLEHASRMSAKVDSAAVQDGYQLYHHVFLFDRAGHWAVIQQGMNETARLARRYHWLGQQVKSFVAEPHSGVAGRPGAGVLNLTAHKNAALRSFSLELSRSRPVEILATLRKLEEDPASFGRRLTLPAHHAIPSSRHIDKILYRLYDLSPASYSDLLATAGVGASTLRALAMTAEVVCGARPTFEDPVRYSFAHGGKDAHPFPVRRGDYKASRQMLEEAVRRARIDGPKKLRALRRLAASDSLTFSDKGPAQTSP